MTIYFVVNVRLEFLWCIKILVFLKKHLCCSKWKNNQFYQYNNLTNFSTQFIIFINICEDMQEYQWFLKKLKKIVFLEKKKYKISFYFFWKAAVYIFYFEESKCYNFLTSINSRHNLFILICLAEPYRLIKKSWCFLLMRL